MKVRGPVRLALLALTVSQVLVEFCLVRIFRKPTAQQRAIWLHHACQLIMRRLKIPIQVEGPLPQGGLVVSNHLSYLDILFYSATMPCVFVSKIEVASWPLFGPASRFGGSVFVDRSSAASAAEATAQVESLLRQGVTVLLFPEGTSTDGSEVLRFHPTFFEPAIRSAAPITAAAIEYPEGPGFVERDVCYYGDIHFAPHILQVLGYHGVTGHIRFASEAKIYDHRRAGASHTQSEVIGLRAIMRDGEPVDAFKG